MPTGSPGFNPRLSGEDPEIVTLYNGIRAPSSWPPNNIPLQRDALTNISVAPIACPYIDNPPNPIIVRTAAGVGGRQLFVDDFLIESTDMVRVWKDPTDQGPVLTPSEAWEVSSGLDDTYAMAFSGGVNYDAGAGLYKLHYYGGRNNTCYAESATGLPASYTKPDLGGGTNICKDWSSYPTGHDSDSVWFDPADPDPSKRWKMAATTLNPGDSFWHQDLHYSADGKTWGPRVAVTGQCIDRTTFHFNPFRQRWVWSIRDFQNTLGLVRYRRIWEQAVWGTGWWPALNNPENSLAKPVLWFRAQQPDDFPRHDTASAARDIDNGGTPQLHLNPVQTYNIDGCAYESLMVYAISELDANFSYPGRPKGNWIRLAFSRDGFHMTHPSPRRPFIRLSTVAQNYRWGNVQSVNPVVQVDQDTCRYHYSCRGGIPGVVLDSGICSTGMATTRRDGFCSMTASGGEKVLTTRRMRFDSGTKFYINARANGGAVKVEMIDGFGAPIANFTKADSSTVSSDTTWTEVTWAASIASQVGRIVRFRFYCTDADLYSFGVTDSSGNAGGFIHQGRA